jgi:hypothetical protein
MICDSILYSGDSVELFDTLSHLDLLAAVGALVTKCCLRAKYSYKQRHIDIGITR